MRRRGTAAEGRPVGGSGVACWACGERQLMGACLRRAAGGGWAAARSGQVPVSQVQFHANSVGKQLCFLCFLAFVYSPPP